MEGENKPSSSCVYGRAVSKKSHQAVNELLTAIASSKSVLISLIVKVASKSTRVKSI